MPDATDPPDPSDPTGPTGPTDDAAPGRDAPGRTDRAAPQPSDAADPCDYDLSAADNQEALWLDFQRQRQASCPVTGAEITLALSHDPADDPAGEAHTEVSARCSRCGRHATFNPPGAADIYGWAE